MEVLTSGAATTSSNQPLSHDVLTQSWRLPTLLLLATYSGILAVMLVSYSARRVVPSAEFESVVAFGWSILLPLWIAADARRRRHDLFFDFGLYCYLLLPTSVLYYCLWSRGLRGLGILTAVGVLFMAPWILSAVVAS